MAYTEIKPIHQWKGKTVLQTLSEVIGYATNENKTTYIDKDNVKKLLVQRYECSKNAAEEWDLIKSEYKKITGRSQGVKDILAYRIIQSFDPKDNISPELANRLGGELANKLTNGEFSYVVATHLDKEHIHNHIIINSTSLDATYKYRNIIKSIDIIQELSDEFCKQHGLSVIEEVKNNNSVREDKSIDNTALEDGEVENSGGEDKKHKKKTKYIHWLNNNFDKRISQEDKGTWQNILRQVIDIILNRKSRFNVLSKEAKQELQEKIQRKTDSERNDLRPKDFLEFLDILKSYGYEFKGLENKYISVRAKGQKKFTRLNAKTLGDEYTKNNLIDYIENYSSSQNWNTAVEKIENNIFDKPRLNKIIDVKDNEKAQSNVGYERWAKLQNLKTLADTHSYLVTSNLTFSHINDMVFEKENEVTALGNQKDIMQKYTERQKEIGVLQNHLINYVKNRKVFEEYKKSGYSKNFKEENADALQQYDQARKYFDEYKSAHGIEKLPTMQELKDEYANLKETKSSYYDELKARREELKLLQTLKTNAMELLGVDENGGKTKSEKEIKREQEELIKVQKERLAQEKKYKNRNKNFR